MSELESLRVALADQRTVRLAYVFGSVARGEARGNSDLDIALDLDPSDPESIETVREAIERASARDVQIVHLDAAPPLLLREIAREGIVVACRDEDARARFELRAITTYLDTQHLRDIQARYLRARAMGERGGQG